MAGEIISERRATSNRNGGRHHRGFAGDFPRNPHAGADSAAGGARSGDDGSARRREGRADGGPAGLPSGYYGRTLITRIGKLELRVPQDRTGRFSTELFGRYQRSERALVAALAEMYVQGVSTRKVKAITEELCGHSFSASAISAINQRLDDGLAQFAGRPLAEAFAYLY